MSIELFLTLICDNANVMDVETSLNLELLCKKQICIGLLLQCHGKKIDFRNLHSNLKQNKSTFFYKLLKIKSQLIISKHNS